MGNFKKSFDLGGMTINVEVKEKTPSCSCGCTTPSWKRPVVPCVPNREPDGFDAHIDRPRREMYGGWDAEWGYQNDLKKYRAAEKAVKACNWPCREPMGNVQWPVPQNVARHSWETTCCCSTPTWNRPTPQPQCEVRQKCGIPPIGAKVVAHRWGEPVFDR